MIDKIIKDKSILVGDEKVIKKTKWVPFSEISTSLDVLNHHIFSDAFQNILKTFKPTHKIAFMSMCTSTRPYYLSRKWKEFKNYFDGLMDLIVISNGGIIPEEYWESYPYLNYDGVMSGKKDDYLYYDKTSKRLKSFLTKHHYDYIIVNFKPHGRFTKVANDILPQLKELGMIKDFIIIPDKILYTELQNSGFPSGKMFPDLDPRVINQINQHIGKFK